MKYYALTDKINKDEVVRRDNGKYYVYRHGLNEWRRSGIMTSYNWPDDVLYGQYYEVSEPEAMTLVQKKGEVLDKLLKLAEKVAAEAHSGQTDKGGEDYIGHPKAVAASLQDTELKIVAWLHDVCEDSDVTPENLLQMGFPPRIVRSVDVLTKGNESYDEYLKKVKSDNNAWQVKMADLRHNMDVSRIPNPSLEDKERLRKYRKALEYLET